MNCCPICHRNNVWLKFRLNYNVYQCWECGFQFAPDAVFNKSFASELDEVTRQKALKGLRVLNFNKIVSVLKRHLKSNASGVEIGCGHGWFLEICKRNSIICSGIEPEKHFNVLYDAMGVTVYNGFFPEAIPIDKKYDFIVYNDVFEHLPDIESLMRINNSLLNENGKLVINLPLRFGLVYKLSVLAYYFGIKSILNRMWQFNFHSPHLSYFSKRNLIMLAEMADFELLEFFSLKTINISEVKDRVAEDKSFNFLFRFLTVISVYTIMKVFPDTYCFIFQKKNIY